MYDLQLDEVWLSSIEHIEKFNQITSELVWWKHLLRIQKNDDAFPQIITSGLSSPIIFYAIGQLEMNDENISFTAQKPENSKKTSYKNVQNNLNFELELNEIHDFSYWKNPNPPMKKFNYPWVKMTHKNGTEYLISNAKKVGEIKKGIKNTELIYEFFKSK